MLDPNTPNNPNFNAITGGDVAAAQDLFDRIQKYAFGGEPDTSDGAEPRASSRGASNRSVRSPKSPIIGTSTSATLK